TTRITCIYTSICRAGVPLVDGRVELDAGVGAAPGALGDPVPEVAGLECLLRLRLPAVCHGRFEFGAPVERPGAVVLDGLHELVRDADAVVAVLAADGVVRLRGPVGVVLLEVNVRLA